MQYSKNKPNPMGGIGFCGKRFDIGADRSERVPYKVDGVPLYAARGVLSRHEGRTMVSHWHDDVEFILPASGHMRYNVSGTVYDLDERHGIFVNSRQMHFGYADDGADCEYLCVLAHPSLLSACERVRREFVAPVVERESLQAMLLTPEIAWQKEALTDVCRVYYSMTGREKPDVLRALGLLFDLWAELSEHAPAAEELPSGTVAQLATLKRMLAYIQTHFAEKVQLEDVARAGGVSQSTCFQIFRKVLDQTPVFYLTNYRLSESLELLKEPGRGLESVARDSGFASVGYFTTVFRSRFGLTPREYRANSLGKAD